LRNKNNNLELDFERINIFYANSSFAYLGTALSVLFLSFIVYKYASPYMAVLWVLSVFVSYLPRIIVSIIFKRKLKNHEIIPGNIKPWERYFILSSILPFLCFAGVIFIPYQENTFISILFCTVIILSMVAGGVLTYSTSKGVMMLHINISLLLLIARYFWMQNILFTVLGCYLIIAYILIMRLAHKQNKAFIENIALKIESKYQSLMDPLTRLWNRRRLYLYIEKLIPASRRSGEPFSIIMLDIDHFKKFNDSHGHNAGDDLLVEVSGILLKCSREQDLVVRYGGEEFIMVLPSTNIEQAKIIAERIHTTVKENTNVTISAGLSEYTDQVDFDQLVRQADEALYEAKNSGRDRYILATAS
jgi:diguanylate cyclase (GGDEF)-like protein